MHVVLVDLKTIRLRKNNIIFQIKIVILSFFFFQISDEINEAKKRERMGDERPLSTKRRRVSLPDKVEPCLRVKTESELVENGPSVDKSTSNKSAGDSSDVEASNTYYSTLNESAVNNIATASSSVANSVNICDLNEKCLVEIMKRLEFPDLLNMANSTKKLCAGACVLYSERYANKSVKYNGDAINTKGLEIDVSDKDCCWFSSIAVCFISIVISVNVYSLSFVIPPIVHIILSLSLNASN